MNEHDIDALIEKYDRSVPRYTSFPTALKFEVDQSEDGAVRQLMQLDVGEPVSVYVHIPYCHSLCHYCGCLTNISNVYTPVERYIADLLQEITQVRERIGHPLLVSRIHFGGGSPNYASVDDLKRILDCFSKHFILGTDTQIDMECDPRLLNKQKIGAYGQMGVTRISLGIQDFNVSVQKAINRVQPFEWVAEQVGYFRDVGIDHINFDLITGLPNQTLGTVAETLDKVLALRPSRVAVFAYAHVPWIKKHQKLLEAFDRPDARTRFDMGLLVRDTLKQDGYEGIGIDHFSLRDEPLVKAQRLGALRRNFQGYTDDRARTILGFGLSSISQFEGAYIQNTTDLPGYREAITHGRLPVYKGYVLTEEDKIRQRLIERLMCDFKIRFCDYDQIDAPVERFMPFVQDGLITMSADQLCMTPLGKPFVRVVAACFDPYLQEGGTGHAKAV